MEVNTAAAAAATVEERREGRERGKIEKKGGKLSEERILSSPDHGRQYSGNGRVRRHCIGY